MYVHIIFMTNPPVFFLDWRCLPRDLIYIFSRLYIDAHIEDRSEEKYTVLMKKLFIRAGKFGLNGQSPRWKHPKLFDIIGDRWIEAVDG